MRSIAKSSSEAESTQIVSHGWNLEVASSDAGYENALHLNVIGRPRTDTERQKLRMFRENSPEWVGN